MDKKTKGWPVKPSYQELSSQLDLWFKTEFGQAMLNVQMGLIDEKLARCFGYHLLQLSVCESSHLFNDCRVQRQYRYITQANTSIQRLELDDSSSSQTILGGYEELPFDSNSIDVVILHHIQEFIENPHQLLREIQRIVVPRGTIILVGFNPWSPLGAYSRIAKFIPNSVWHNQLISCRRICDWLSLLGFDVSSRQYGFSTPKLLKDKTNLRLMPALDAIPLGNFYCISAIKQQATLSPIKPVWKTGRSRFSGLSPVKSRVGGSLINPHRVLKRNDEDVA